MAGITVADAQRLASERDKDVVMLIGWHFATRRMNVVTFGRDGYEAKVQRLHDQVYAALDSPEEYADQLAARTADVAQLRRALLASASRVSDLAATLEVAGICGPAERLHHVVADMRAASQPATDSN